MHNHVDNSHKGPSETRFHLQIQWLCVSSDEEDEVSQEVFSYEISDV